MAHLTNNNKPRGQNSSTGAGIIHNHHVIVAAAPEHQVPSAEAHHDGDKHADVERHDGQHQEERSINGNRLVFGSAERGNKFESQTAILHVLVEDGEDEAGEQGEGVAGPRVGFPEIEQNGDVFAPVEGHVHHLRCSAPEIWGRGIGMLRYGSVWTKKYAVAVVHMGYMDVITGTTSSPLIQRTCSTPAVVTGYIFE
nr:G-protein coupled receptor 1 [Ipomoea batatas]